MIRFLLRVIAILAVGIGSGVFAWGMAAAAYHEPIRDPAQCLQVGCVISSPSEAVGWGAGFLVGGLTALLASCLGEKKK